MTALPPVATLALQGGASVLAALCVASVVTSVAAYTVQNHENLLAAVVGEEVSVRLARTDHLTGLPNRIELDVRLKAACAALPPPSISERRGVCTALPGPGRVQVHQRRARPCHGR